MKVKNILLMAAVTLLSLAWNTGNAEVKEGKDYSVLSGKKASSKPHVYEFFSYHCGHCYNVEPVLQKWKKNEKPEEVKFEQVPVFIEHMIYAYYTAEALGIKEEAHQAFFYKWHVEKQPIKDKAALIPIFEELGVKEADFEKAYNSFGVANKVQYANKLARDFKVTSTPTLMVNKKYKVESLQNLSELLGPFALENTK
ncbi:thiol:disulfide interchange protein DsbA/DsbL [Kangiella sediminilitoris]|uniref:Thiol:disulfide interchange protein n=1 Tax=Kangiella sediminilitoris TaxID=1144748 RepID=A0A1B3BDW3_9GAMM|nr:thiol:disulfide interchange protein DsbA/DsbL [Kangiella sediminilitoris]AOE51016.1 Thiol:disulfide interchange protein [Kangiella sediminilitoris]